MEHANWKGFKSGIWQQEINVRDFIQANYKEYLGDSSFLETSNMNDETGVFNSSTSSFPSRTSSETLNK